MADAHGERIFWIPNTVLAHRSFVRRESFAFESSALPLCCMLINETSRISQTFLFLLPIKVVNELQPWKFPQSETKDSSRLDWKNFLDTFYGLSSALVCSELIIPFKKAWELRNESEAHVSLSLTGSLSVVKVTVLQRDFTSAVLNSTY